MQPTPVRAYPVYANPTPADPLQANLIPAYQDHANPGLASHPFFNPDLSNQSNPGYTVRPSAAYPVNQLNLVQVDPAQVDPANPFSQSEIKVEEHVYDVDFGFSAI